MIKCKKRKKRKTTLEDLFSRRVRACVMLAVVQVWGSKAREAEVEEEEVGCSVVLRCEEAVGGRGGSAVEIIPGFCPKSCARWADQGLREEWCYPVAVTQPRAFHLTILAALQP